ncbi:MAG: DUF192 domain-containing protein [Candidatus Micrarchaeales archaeon]
MLTRFLYNHTKFKTKQMKLKGKNFNMLIADSFAKKAIGLMYRKKINADQGMLFNFPVERKWKIWMLNMKFPLDILWLDKNGIVIHIEKNLKPCSSMFSCPNYSPDADAKYVIEINAGICSKLGIKVGDRIDTN